MRVPQLTQLALLTAALTLSCGPSQADPQAKKAEEAKARTEAAIKAAQTAARPPVLTAKDVIQKSDQGLQYVDLKQGTGPAAAKGGTVTVHFTGWVDGVKMDSSEDRGKPFSFILGSDDVISGWNIGIPGMKEGGTRLLIIPPNLAYGEEGKPGSVGRKKTLWYRIDLVKAYQPY